MGEYNPPIHKILWLIVRLRYQLAWAHARTTNGKIALAVAMQFVLLSLFLFFSLVGIRAAIAGVRMGRSEEIARWILTGLFINSVVIGAVIGAGPREAFSATALRRYPIGAVTSFVLSHLTGLFDPIWPLLLALVLGLAYGFSPTGSEAVLIGVPTSFLFVITAYLTTVALLSIIDRLLSHRTGMLIFGLALLSLMLYPMLIGSLDAGRVQKLDGWLKLAPPGLAASLVAGSVHSQSLFANVQGLIGWCLMLMFLLLAISDRRQPSVSSPASASIVASHLYNLISKLFGGYYAPLVSKSLQDFLRCNFVRLGLIAGVVSVAGFNYMFVTASEIGPALSIMLSYSFITTFVATGQITINLFGSEGAGIKRYPILPVQLEAALRAASYTSLILGGAVLSLALAVWILIASIPMSIALILSMIFSGVAGLFYMNALGLLTTVYSPARWNPQRVIGNKLSVGGYVVMISSLLLFMLSLPMLDDRLSLEIVEKYWWAPLLLSIACFTFYFTSLRFTTRVLDDRWEGLADIIAGASDN